MDYAIDSHFGFPAKSRALKDRDPGGKENFILDRAAIQRGIRPYPNVIPDLNRMSGCGTNQRVFADDRLLGFP